MELNEVLAEFGISGEIKSLGNGLINDTYLVGDFVLQKINTTVFPFPQLIMENFSKISHHLEKKLRDPRKFLKLKKTNDGRDYFFYQGCCFRVVNFIRGSQSFLKPPSEDYCFEAAQAFGSFQKDLLDLKGIVPTQRQKFELVTKLKEFQEMNRTPEITWALNNYFQISLDLPKRLIHHDTKISNVLFDQETSKGLCVIDLDTVGEDPILWDFGDMIRSMAPTVSEEEEFAHLDINLPFFKSIVSGYMAGANFLSEKERYSLLDGALMITYTLALRFLADHFNGDVYFKTKYPGHNFFRAKNQMKLFEVLRKNEKELRKIIMKD